MNKKYKLQYLPLFEQDLLEAVSYIANNLKNPKAADRLISDTEKAILDRLEAPTAFQPYTSKKPRKYPYYRILIRNFSVL